MILYDIIVLVTLFGLNLDVHSLQKSKHHVKVQRSNCSVNELKPKLVDDEEETSRPSSFTPSILRK